MERFARFAIAASVAAAIISGQPTRAVAQSSSSGISYIGALINVSNLDRSIDFYTHIVGLKEARRVAIGPGSWEVILSPDGTDLASQIALVYRPDHTQPVEHGNGLNRLCFFVKSENDVDKIARKISAAGYATVIPPTTAPISGGRLYRFTHMKDPDDYTIEFTWFDPNVIVPKT